MITSDIVWAPKKVEDDKIRININGFEEMNKEEFLDSYQDKLKEINQIWDQTVAFKKEIMKIGEIEETPQVMQFKKEIENARKLIKRDELRAKIQDLELRHAQLKKIIEPLADLAKSMKS
jgi:hypothetical protein